MNNTDLKSLYSRRAQALQQAMWSQGVDMFLAATSVNMLYLSGFQEPPLERLMFLAVPRESEPFWFVPDLSMQSASENPAGWAIGYHWHDSAGPMGTLQAFAQAQNLPAGVFAIDDEMHASALLMLQEALPAALFRPGGELIASVRAVKDDLEHGLMLEAARLTDDALVSGFELCAPGHTEWAVALAIQRALHEMGSKLAFGIPMVGAGENSAKPHYNTGHRAFQEGDVVVIDFGGMYEGYCSDITRAVCIGQASEEARKVYRIVYKSHEAARKAAKPGVLGSDIDRAARAVIEAAGYGDYFVHRTGHGIGLAVHEPPYIAQTYSKPIEEGHCFTVEPGIYLPGKFGVRIENVYFMAAEGAVSLNAEPPSEIREIG
ncbi:MAG: aminopeptidase P family protein [Fimbriimonadia bacterium]|nr:aminopeptidase P family protein [Fimbriimonadia bacterium]